MSLEENCPKAVQELLSIQEYDANEMKHIFHTLQYIGIFIFLHHVMTVYEKASLCRIWTEVPLSCFKSWNI
jgi:hypothetical protein